VVGVVDVALSVAVEFKLPVAVIVPLTVPDPDESAVPVVVRVPLALSVMVTDPVGAVSVGGIGVWPLAIVANKPSRTNRVENRMLNERVYKNNYLYISPIIPWIPSTHNSPWVFFESKQTATATNRTTDQSDQLTNQSTYHVVPRSRAYGDLDCRGSVNKTALIRDVLGLDCYLLVACFLPSSSACLFSHYASEVQVQV
jgi:hypothetical protein